MESTVRLARSGMRTPTSSSIANASVSVGIIHIPRLLACVRVQVSKCSGLSHGIGQCQSEPATVSGQAFFRAPTHGIAGRARCPLISTGGPVRAQGNGVVRWVWADLVAAGQLERKLTAAGMPRRRARSAR